MNFNKDSKSESRVVVVGGEFFDKLTKNPNLNTKIFLFWEGMGGGGGGGIRYDLDLQPTQTNVSDGTTIPQGEHLSMHKCRSYGPDKLIYETFKCDLDLQPTLKMFQMTLLLHKDNNCVR